MAGTGKQLGAAFGSAIEPGVGTAIGGIVGELTDNADYSIGQSKVNPWLKLSTQLKTKIAKDAQQAKLKSAIDTLNAQGIPVTESTVTAIFNGVKTQQIKSSLATLTQRPKLDWFHSILAVLGF